MCMKTMSAWFEGTSSKFRGFEMYSTGISIPQKYVPILDNTMDMSEYERHRNNNVLRRVEDSVNSWNPQVLQIVR
jgi:hypothetical protein